MAMYELSFLILNLLTVSMNEIIRFHNIYSAELEYVHCIYFKLDSNIHV